MKATAFARLALKSLVSRRATALLTGASIALSTALLLSVDKIGAGARAGFESTVSGVDLIVGARTSPVNLLLYSVFGVGSASANVSPESVALLAASPAVAWTAPLSLGDSHRGFRVLGTTGAYFDHYKYANARPLTFAAGARFSSARDAVIGDAVARSLDYKVGDTLVIAHGLEHAGFAEHKDDPFRIAGILARTGTPVDRTVIVSLAGLDAIHEPFAQQRPLAAARAGVNDHDHDDDHDDDHHDDHSHDDSHNGQAADPHDHEETGPVSAVLIGLKTRSAALAFQRDVNAFGGEALSAILPGVAIADLWSVVGQVEAALAAVTALVVVTGFLGLMAALLAGLNERRREIAILRTLGASPRTIASLMICESALIAFAGALVGACAGLALLRMGAPLLEARLGASFADITPTLRDGAIVLAITVAGALAGALPAWRAYRRSLADGLSIGL